MNDVAEAIRATNRSPFEAVFESKMVVLQNPISKLMLERDDSYSLLPSSSPKEGLGSSTMKTISVDTITTAKKHKTTTKKDFAANDEQHQESSSEEKFVSEGKTNSCIISNDLQQGITKGKDSQADDEKAENDHQTQQDVVVGAVAAPKVSPLCKMGCGFFVSDATGNYCSKCSPLNGEPVDRKDPKTPTPCKVGCGFFGSSETGDCCSKCWMEMKQQQDRLLKQESAPLSILTDDTDDDSLQEGGDENSLNDELRKYQQNEQENDDEDEGDDSNSKKKDGEMSALEMVRKGTVAVVGGTLVGLGVVLVALPIPLGVPVTCGGLAVLGTEFDEAREMNEALIQETKDKLANARDHAIRTIENMESNCCSSSDDDSNKNDKDIESSLSSSSYDTCYEGEEDDDWLTSNPDEITKFESMMKTKYQKFPKEEDIRQTRSWSVAKSTSSFLSKTVLPILKRTKLGDEESTSSENDDHEDEDASPHADSQQPTSDSSSSSKNSSDDATMQEPPPTSSSNGRDALEEEEQESPIEEAVLIARPDVDDCDNVRGCFMTNSGGDCSAIEVMVIESST